MAKRITKKAAVKKARPKKVVAKKAAISRKIVQNKVVSLKLKSDDSMQLDAKKLGNALGKVTALCIFIVSVLAMSGRAPGWTILADVMYGPFGYWPGTFLLGVVWGTVLGYAKGFVIGWLVAKIYNKSSGCCSFKKK